MATKLFSLYLGKRLKPRGKFAKTFFWRTLVFRGKLASSRAKSFFFLKSLGKFVWDLFLRTLGPCVLGLEHSCPWPREGLSSRSRSLALDFFVFSASKVDSISVKNIDFWAFKMWGFWVGGTKKFQDSKSCF